MINQLPNGMNICDTCLEDGEEELDLNDPHNIDEDTMQKALNLTKDKREVEN